MLLYLSYNLHNIINWIKLKPFLPRWGLHLYLWSVIAVFPFWIAEIYFNFAYHNHLGGHEHFRQIRPFEALFREPWWIFTTIYLVYIIKRCYNLSIDRLVRLEPRFAMLMASIALSLAFIIADVVETARNSSFVGRNPFWKVCEAIIRSLYWQHNF